MNDEKILCDLYGVEISWDEWPCFSCACNPKGENCEKEFLYSLIEEKEPKDGFK
jgi:hypothetical protein